MRHHVVANQAQNNKSIISEIDENEIILLFKISKCTRKLEIFYDSYHHVKAEVG